jgi:hypothetical protein
MTGGGFHPPYDVADAALIRGGVLLCKDGQRYFWINESDQRLAISGANV